MGLVRWRRRFDCRGIWLFLAALAGVGLALLLIARINVRLRPILLELALAQTKQTITQAVDRAVAAQAVEYADLVTLERGEGGDIVALTSDLARANDLRARLLEAALASLDGLEHMELEVPLGTLFGSDLLSGLGPGVNARVLYTGSATAEFENQFSSAGINQTRHQIFFLVSADISVLLPGRQVHTCVTTRVCVAETVIVGKVPETYLTIEP